MLINDSDSTVTLLDVGISALQHSLPVPSVSAIAGLIYRRLILKHVLLNVCFHATSVGHVSISYSSQLVVESNS